MTHQEFIRCYQQKECIPRIMPVRALRLMISRGVPARYRATFQFWAVVWTALLLATAALLVAGQILNALIALIFVVFLPGGVIRYAANFIIAHALEHSEFYAAVTRSGVMQAENEAPPHDENKAPAQ